MKLLTSIFALNFLFACFLKTNNIYIPNQKTDKDSKSSKSSIVKRNNKKSSSNDGNEDLVEPDIPTDGSSGLDDDKYLELDVFSDGSYDLPNDADYSGDLGSELLRFVKPGDIMFDPVGMGSSGSGTGHVAIIEGIAYSQTYNKNYIVTIEANPNHGVKRGYLDKARFEDHKTLLRVNGANLQDINDAIFFCLMQLDKPYLLNIFGKHTSINSDSWYCSELVWAAYLWGQNEIDLSNGAVYGIMPQDINDDSDTSKIIKYNCNTSMMINSTHHTFYCDGDVFTEPHNHDGEHLSMEQCTVCNHIFWPGC